MLVNRTKEAELNLKMSDGENEESQWGRTENRERDGESEAERKSARVTDSERELGAERLKVKGWRKKECIEE